MSIQRYVRVAAVALPITLAWSLVGAVPVSAQSEETAETTWALRYDANANRFSASSAEASICDRFGEGSGLTDDGSGCWYAPTLLGFLPDLGFTGDASGFRVVDSNDDVLVFRESRAPDQMRYDIIDLQWTRIDASDVLLQGAADAPGAVVGEAFDGAVGPRVALFITLSEPPIDDGDALILDVNSTMDDDAGNDMIRSLDPGFPSGGGDINVSAGWHYPEGPGERQDVVAVWSQAQGNIIPSNIVVGPSEDPPGVWALIGPEHIGERFNVTLLPQPAGMPTFIDRVEGVAGPSASFELDGSTQAYFDGFTMAGTAKIPGKDFQFVFHTPYAALFEGGTANIDYLMDATEDVVEGLTLETTGDTVSFGLSLPTGATGINDVAFVPSAKTEVEVTDRKKPVAVEEWLKGDQLAEINAAANEIMEMSLPSRFELADGQAISLGATPN